MAAPEVRIAVQVFGIVIGSFLLGLRTWALRLKSRRHSIEVISTPCRASNILILTTFVIGTFSALILIYSGVKQLHHRGENHSGDEYIRDARIPAIGDVPADKLVKILVMNYVLNFVYSTMLWLCKAAFLAFYFDLVHYLRRRLRWLLYFTTAYTITTFLLCIGLSAFWCLPVKLNWEVKVDVYCSPFQSPIVLILQTFANVSSDILIMTMPLSLLLRPGILHPRERHCLAILLLVGVATIATAVVRFCILYQGTGHTTSDKTEFSGVHVQAHIRYESYEIVSSIECQMAFIAACLPSLRILVYRYFPSVNSTLGNRTIAERLQSGLANSQARTKQGARGSDVAREVDEEIVEETECAASQSAAGSQVQLRMSYIQQTKENEIGPVDIHDWKGEETELEVLEAPGNQLRTACN